MILVGCCFCWFYGSMVLFFCFVFCFWTIFDSSIYSGWFACPCCVKALLSSSSPVLKKHHQPVPGSDILDKVSKNKFKPLLAYAKLTQKNVYFRVKNISEVINNFRLKLFHVGHKHINLIFEEFAFYPYCVINSHT